ncbi:MAG: hypothetical protein E7330_07850 [Clostridiales bacterium]|nr:hypothetical protein [Clostridiales bacterium]
MKRIFRLLALLCAVCFAASACAVPADSGDPSGKALSELQRIYKNAALVVTGLCVQQHINSDGNTCYDLSVEEVIAGSTAEDALIHCTVGQMEEGGRYLLYLAEGEDLFYTEDTNRYELLSESPLALSDEGMVEYAGTELSLSELKQDIRQMDAVITVPASFYYYKSLRDLVEAADEIFIGRVVAFAAEQDRSFRAQTDGTVVENTLPAAIAKVEAYGSLKGALNYGDRISLVYAPKMCASLVDASTLKPVAYGEGSVPSLQENGIYLFFLTQSPDAKQNYRFAVNPMQGYVAADTADRLSVPYVNRALYGFDDLASLVKEIRAALEG